MSKRSIVMVGGSRRVVHRDSNGRFVAAKKAAPAKTSKPAAKTSKPAAKTSKPAAKPAKKSAPAKA